MVSWHDNCRLVFADQSSSRAVGEQCSLVCSRRRSPLEAVLIAQERDCPAPCLPQSAQLLLCHITSLPSSPLTCVVTVRVVLSWAVHSLLPAAIWVLVCLREFSQAGRSQLARRPLSPSLSQQLHLGIVTRPVKHFQASESLSFTWLDIGETVEQPSEQSACSPTLPLNRCVLNRIGDSSMPGSQARHWSAKYICGSIDPCAHLHLSLLTPHLLSLSPFAPDRARIGSVEKERVRAIRTIGACVQLVALLNTNSLSKPTPSSSISSISIFTCAPRFRSSSDLVMPTWVIFYKCQQVFLYCAIRSSTYYFLSKYCPLSSFNKFFNHKSPIMNESLSNGEYISYTLHPHQQAMGYATLNGSGHQQQYGIMHPDLLQQAASGLLSSGDAGSDGGPLMMSQSASGGVLLTLNGSSMGHNGNSNLHQSQQGQQQYSTTNGTTVLVSANGNVQSASQSLTSPQTNGGGNGQSGQQNSQRSSTNSNSTNNSSSPPVHHHHSSKKKRKCHWALSSLDEVFSRSCQSLLILFPVMSLPLRCWLPNEHQSRPVWWGRRWVRRAASADDNWFMYNSNPYSILSIIPSDAAIGQSLTANRQVMIDDDQKVPFLWLPCPMPNDWHLQLPSKVALASILFIFKANRISLPRWLGVRNGQTVVLRDVVVMCYYL